MASSNIQEDVKHRRSLFGNATFAEVKVPYPEEYLDRVQTETFLWKTYTYKMLRKRGKLTKKLLDKELPHNQLMLTNEQLDFLGLINFNVFCNNSKIFLHRTNLLTDLCYENIKWFKEMSKNSDV